MTYWLERVREARRSRRAYEATLLAYLADIDETVVPLHVSRGYRKRWWRA